MSAAGQPGTVLLLCVVIELSWADASSPDLRASHVTRVGQNLSLPCNLTASRQVTWFHLHEDHLVPLLTIHLNNFNQTDVSWHVEDKHHFRCGGDTWEQQVSLELVHVNETDAGLYFCGHRCNGVICFSRGLQLTVEGSESRVASGDAQELPCWALVISLSPVWFLLCSLCVYMICFRSGKTPVCCSACVDRDTSLKDGGLHYASLMYPGKPRPSAEGRTGLAQENVIYSLVSEGQ